MAVSVGTLYGAIAGYAGGWIDNVLMRALDAFTAFPKLFLILLLAGVFEADIGVLILIMGVTSWTDTARLIRGEILSLKQRQFVEAAHAIGLPDYLIVWRHLIPNAMSSVLVSATLMVGGLIGVEAMLSFLGIGVHPPTPTWGNMIEAGQDAARHQCGRGHMDTPAKSTVCRGVRTCPLLDNNLLSQQPSIP